MPDLVKPESDQQLIAKIALTGNLAPLTEAQRWDYYQAYCRHLALDPITRPFDLITQTEKDGTKVVKLYANASCSAQLADNRHVTYSRPELEHDEITGSLIIWVKAMLPNGREEWNCGVIHIQTMNGRQLENAIKKATTQAHRRATLALCGISMPDESEIEDIPAAQTARIAAPSTEPQWVDPAIIHEELAPAREKLAEVKAAQSGGTLAIKKEPESEPEYGPKNPRYSEESVKRLNAVCRRLTGFGVQGRDMLASLNHECGLDREIKTRYELTDDEVAKVCEQWEPWAQRLEEKAAKAAKKAEA